MLSSSKTLVPLQATNGIGEAIFIAGFSQRNSAALSLLRSEHARTDQRFENLHPICAAQCSFTGALRMRHHAEHISSRTTDSGNVIQRPVRTRFSRDLSSLIAIAEHNAIIAPQLRQCRLIAEIIAFHVPDRNAKHITFAARACERSI